MEDRGQTTIERFFGHSHEGGTTLPGKTYCLRPRGASSDSMEQRTKSMLRSLTNVLDNVVSTDEALLWCIGGDLDPGGFPDCLFAFFRDERWDYSTRYWIREARKAHSRCTVLQGWLTCEGDSGLVERLLASSDVPWRSNQRIAGLQVSASTVDQLVSTNPYELDLLQRAARSIGLAFQLDTDLLFADFFLPDGSSGSLRAFVEEFRA